MELFISLMIVIIGILAFLITTKIPKKGIQIKENSLGYTKEEFLDIILEDRSDIKKGDDFEEKYDYNTKEITIKNEDSKELGEILNVIDILAASYDSNIKVESLLAKILEYSSIVVFIIYYMLDKYIILFFISLMLISSNIIMRYYIYRKNRKIRKDIILKGFNFKKEENINLLKGGKQIERILRICILVIFVLITVLFYKYLLL